jgi:FPC/CPF motif-containing protein YcgG
VKKGNPFDSEIALSNSALHWANDGRLTAYDKHVGDTPFLVEAHAAFREIVLQPDFSCVGAKAALNNNAYGFAAYSELAQSDSTAGLCRDLCNFAKSRLVKQNEYASFIAVFREPPAIDEARFEELLWQTLYQLHDADRHYFNWAPSVSASPADPEFSFSFAERAFYVLGMHPNSSRVARTVPWPVLVFNPHEQFERLRTVGKWKRMQRTIRTRELVLQGTINPMLSDFGEESEARQYSGRAVPDDWTPPLEISSGKCPFH